ncbi:MAG: hypothetical protein HUJ91_05390, partial [Bacteroidales bacterium]|nr:hypothetical protein [Bacteroidales bacterium]
MKNLLKFAFCTLFCVMLASACDPEVHDGEAKLNSLVFTVSANPSLGSDCVATINGTDITVVVPEGVSLVGLVPTFTVTINDIVSVGSAVVTSGETPCNFSSNAKIKVTDTAEDITTEYSISFQFNDGTAELKNFGFYKADNSGLDSDYLAESIADEMIIRIPEGGSGKSLVAKFEAGFGDVVTVDGQEVSGTVTVDCTFPIDIVVTDPVAGASKSYVVKVGKILQMVWERVGELSGDYTSMRGDVSV